jgi:hypothetical protein
MVGKEIGALDSGSRTSGSSTGIIDHHDACPCLSNPHHFEAYRSTGAAAPELVGHLVKRPSSELNAISGLHLLGFTSLHSTENKGHLQPLPYKLGCPDKHSEIQRSSWPAPKLVKNPRQLVASQPTLYFGSVSGAKQQVATRCRKSTIWTQAL